MSRLSVITLNKSILWSKDVALRQKCRPIDVENAEELAFAQSLIREMFITLYTDPSGVALAAPQIGALLQMVVINYEDKDVNEYRIMALINPKITSLSDETNEEQEICLSVSNFSGKVIRSNSVEVEAFDQHGSPIKFTAEGFFARVVQHEVDHLSGILCVDKGEKDKVNYIQEFPERNIEHVMRRLGLKKRD